MASNHEFPEPAASALRLMFVLNFFEVKLRLGKPAVAPQLIYELYGLTDKEIALVEEATG